jgi:hypothetical protein
MALDPARQRIVLFGGADAEGRRDDTWEWDGKSWQARPTDVRPPARDHHGMAWDPEGRRILLFGGQADAYLGDTWSWDGTKWQRVATDGPSPRAGKPALATAVQPLGVFLFGGSDAAGPRADLWRWRAGAWKLVDPRR